MPAQRKLESSNFINQRALASTCVVNDALTRIGARWKMQTLHAIHHGVCTFAALKRTLPNVSDHVLATRLRELAAERLVDKQATSQRHHAYQVTARGVELLTIIAALCDWERGAGLGPAAIDDRRQATT